MGGLGGVLVVRVWERWGEREALQNIHKGFAGSRTLIWNSWEGQVEKIREGTRKR